MLPDECYSSIIENGLARGQLHRRRHGRWVPPIQPGWTIQLPDGVTRSDVETGSIARSRSAPARSRAPRARPYWYLTPSGNWRP